jgi:predicted  nucleic acid-binding Zn-ribbon protein
VAFARDGRLVIAGGINERGVAMSDIWQFDGLVWREVGAFDPAPIVFGCAAGLFVINEGGVQAAAENSTLVLLSDGLEAIKNKYAANIERIEQLKKDIKENRREIALLGQKGKDGKSVATFDGVQEKLEKEISQLRAEFVKAGERLLSFHADNFARPPVAPANVVNEYVTRLENELLLVSAKYNRRLAELKAEAQLYATLGAGADPGAPGKPLRTQHDEITQYVDSLRTLQAQKRILAHREEKLAKVVAQTVRDDRRMGALLGSIAALESSIELAGREIAETESKVAGLSATTKSAKELKRLVEHPAKAKKYISKAQKKAQDATAQFAELMKQTLTADQRIAIAALQSDLRSACTGDPLTMLEAAQKGVGMCLGKLTAGQEEAPRPHL